MTRVALAADHAGFQLKHRLIQHLLDKGYQVDDLGTYDDEAVDYPDFGAAVARAVSDGFADLGVGVCGTGIGIAMAANKVRGVRAAVLHDVTSARLAREHTDANVVCLGARLLGPEVAREALDAFLAATYEGGRHDDRIAKISKLEAAQP